MRKVNYRPGKVATTAVLCLLATVALAYFWSSDGGLLLLGGTAFFAYMTAAALRGALGDRPALLFDQLGLTINTLHRSARYDWRDVVDVRVERTTLRMWGIIPVSSKEFLCISGKRGASGLTNYRLTKALIELPAGGLSALHAELWTARMAAVESAASAPAIQPVAEGEATPGFDPDAAIARYLAAKQAAPVADTPAPISRGPPRPTFGRRVG